MAKRYDDDEKHKHVAAAFGGKYGVRAYCEEHGVTTSSLYKWRDAGFGRRARHEKKKAATSDRDKGSGGVSHETRALVKVAAELTEHSVDGWLREAAIKAIREAK